MEFKLLTRQLWNTNMCRKCFECFSKTIGHKSSINSNLDKCLYKFTKRSQRPWKVSGSSISLPTHIKYDADDANYLWRKQ